MLLHPQTLLVQADLGSTDSICRMVESLDNNSLDVLVNNAGVWKSTPLGSTNEALLNEVLDINLRGMFWLTQVALPKLRDGADCEHFINCGTGRHCGWAQPLWRDESGSRFTYEELGARTGPAQNPRQCGRARLRGNRYDGGALG